MQPATSHCGEDSAHSFVSLCSYLPMMPSSLVRHKLLKVTGKFGTIGGFAGIPVLFAGNAPLRCNPGALCRVLTLTPQ